MKKSFLLLLFVSLLPLVMLSGKGMWDKGGDQKFIEVTGVIKIKGNEPHTIIALVSEDGRNYILSGAKSIEIRENYQQKTLFIRAEILKTAEPLNPAELEVVSYKVLN